MNIRPAVPEDADEISKLVRAFETLLVEDAAAAAPFWESMSARAHRENIGSARFAYHVAEAGGEIAGFIAMRDQTHLFNLFVSPSHQGRGVARRLWEHAARSVPPHAKGRPFTVNASLHAVPVYEALGFQKAGDVMRLHGLAFLPMKQACR